MTTLINEHLLSNLSTQITVFKSRNDPQGSRQTIHWSQWFQTLSKSPTTYDKKINIPGWSAATFVDDHRNNKNVELISALVLDVDDGGSLEDTHYTFREWLCRSHPSFKNHSAAHYSNRQPHTSGLKSKSL